MAAESLKSLPISDCQLPICLRPPYRFKVAYKTNRQSAIENRHASDPLNLIRLTPSKGETAIR